MRVVARALDTLDEQYVSDLFLVRALSLAGYAIFLYDFFAAIPDEVTYIWSTRWSAVKVIYLLNRYGNLVFLALADLQIMGLWRSDARTFCFTSTLVLSLLQFASFASIHVLVLLRAWAMWGRHVKILAVLAKLFVAYAVITGSLLTWGIVSTGNDAYPMSHIVGTCVGYIPSYAWAIWIPSLVLECVIFGLTMASVRQYKLNITLARQLTLIQVIFRDGVAYFIITLFSNLFNIFMWAYHADRPLNLLANTFTLCLMLVAGQRLVLDLRKVSADDALSTTRVGREVDRAIEALRADLSHSPSRSPSPILFADDAHDGAAPHRIDVGRIAPVEWGPGDEEEARGAVRQLKGETLEIETLRREGSPSGQQPEPARCAETETEKEPEAGGSDVR
ncbi:hypothetical protein C8Q76DRAFT_321864 [Earliella scabrosa]|nr:hypothetical protein C8Q76DRAFT_321864 [Earliella scabrosa]